jgi:hypothetical protein
LYPIRLHFENVSRDCCWCADSIWCARACIQYLCFVRLQLKFSQKAVFASEFLRSCVFGFSASECSRLSQLVVDTDQGNVQYLCGWRVVFLFVLIFFISATTVQ